MKDYEVTMKDLQDKFLKEPEVAQILNCSVQTLRNNRHPRRGMPYIKNGRAILYSLKDIHTYLNERKIFVENA